MFVLIALLINCL